MNLKDEKLNVVFLWKQNDSGIYGRRADMLLKELSQCSWINRIIEFDAPIDIKTLEEYKEILSNKENTHYQLVYDNALDAYHGNKTIYGVKSYTYVYSNNSGSCMEYPPLDLYFKYVEKILVRNGIKAGTDKILLWNCPINYYLSAWIDYLKPVYIVSDIIDDQRAWSSNEISIQKMTENYLLSIRRSDLLLVNSEEMYHRVLSIDSSAKLKLKLVSNGCEGFLDKRLLKKPALLGTMEGPVIGQVSNLEKKIDFELLAKCAVSHPEWNIVLIGSAHMSNEELDLLAKYKNIYLTGPIPYEQAKCYIAHFDVAIIAHRTVDINKAMNPLKLYVYCSLGASVVSTNIPGIEDLKNIIRVADSADDFVAQIEKALEAPHKYTEQDIDQVNQFSWKHKIEIISGYIFTTKEMLDSENVSSGTTIGTNLISQEQSLPIREIGKRAVFKVPGVNWAYRKWEKINNKIKDLNRKVDGNGRRISVLRRDSFANHDKNMQYIQKLEDRILQLENQIQLLNMKTSISENAENVFDKYDKVTDSHPFVTIVFYYDTYLNGLEDIIIRLIDLSGYDNFELTIIQQFERNMAIDFTKYPRIKLKRVEKKESYEKIVNKIASDTTAEYFAVLKNIINLSSNWLIALLNENCLNENMGMIATRVHYISANSGDNDTTDHDIGRIRFEDSIGDNIYRVAFDLKPSILDEIGEGEMIPSPCVWGDCFLTRTARWREVNGFDACFTHGFEGADLSLRFYKAGYQNYVNKKVYATSSQGLLFDDRNYKIFRYRWQSFISREMLLDKLENKHLFTKQNFVIGIVGDYSEDQYLNAFVDECRKQGHSIKHIVGNIVQKYDIGVEVDLLITVNQVLYEDDLSNNKVDLYGVLWNTAEVLLSRNNEEERIDYILGFDNVANLLYEIIDGTVREIPCTSLGLFYNMANVLKKRTESVLDERSIDILGAMPSDEWKTSWGDYHYALSLKAEFEKHGYKAHVICYPQWLKKSNSKYVLFLRGTEAYYPKVEGQTVIMWNISHPADVSIDEYNACDLVYVASERLSKSLESVVSVPVKTLLQCTDEHVMTYVESEKPEYELLFIGNSRGVFRKIIKDLMPTTHKLTVYGRAWEKYIPKENIAGVYFDNEKVGQAYHDAEILLNDHWDDMREMGLISNRLFDALAVEAFVISDNIPEIKEVFDDAVVTYEGREDLQEKIDYYLAHPEERYKKAKHGQKIVLSKHTFRNRVNTIIEDMKHYGM